MTDHTAVLSVEGLRVAYGDLTAVWDVTTTARSGEMTAILGRNGAGKTTLVKGIAGLIPAASGSVRVGDRDITAAPPWVRARHGVALVQEGKRVFRELTVRENLLIGASGGRRRREDVVAEGFELFPRLAEFERKRAADLSGGQQQLLAIAQAVVTRPEVLIVDEPSSGLAPMVFDHILETLTSLAQNGMAVLLVEQLVEEVLDGHADHVLVLDRGRVVLNERAADVSAEQIVTQFISA